MSFGTDVSAERDQQIYESFNRLQQENVSFKRFEHQTRRASLWRANANFRQRSHLLKPHDERPRRLATSKPFPALTS